MNFIEKALVRKVMKPQIISLGEDHAMLKFEQFGMIKKYAGGYLDRLGDVMNYLPGVIGCELNEQDGSLSINYDATRTDVRKIGKWFDCAVEAGIKASDEMDLASSSGDEIISAIKKHLLPMASDF